MTVAELPAVVCNVGVVGPPRAARPAPAAVALRKYLAGSWTSSAHRRSAINGSETTESGHELTIVART